MGHWGGDGPDIGWHPTNNINDDDANNLGDAQAGTWTHISYTQTGAFTKVFTNGQLSNSEDAALDTFGGIGILVGAQRESDGVAVTGGLKGSLSIGRVRIFDSALSDEDILADFVAAAEGYGVAIGPVDPLPDLENVGITENGVFGVTIPDGVTADIEYSIDLLNWEVIAPGASGALEETDADRIAAPTGFYRAKQ